MLALALILASIVPTANALTSDALELQELRELYLQTRDNIGKVSARQSRIEIEKLKNYPLYPHLRARFLRKHIKHVKRSTVNKFLIEHKGGHLEQQVRRALLADLAGRKQWKSYIGYYRDYVRTDYLQCTYIRALINTRQSDKADIVAVETWLQPRSLPKVCDNVLYPWLAKRADKQQLYKRRGMAALKAEEFNLAQFLLEKAGVSEDSLALLARSSRLETLGHKLPVNDLNRQIVELSIKRVATRDYLAATQYWQVFNQRYKFSETSNFNLRQAIARQMLADDYDDAVGWLIKYDPRGSDEYLMEWRIRLALRVLDWPRVAAWIRLLSPETRAQPRWRYWLARSQQVMGDLRAPEHLLDELSKELGYYSFLSADLLGRDYALARSEVSYDDTPVQREIENLIKNEALIEARELFFADESYAANRAWNIATRGMNDIQQNAAAELAYRWGWYQRAILWAYKAKQYQDLKLRFPLAWESEFSAAAAERELPLPWLYAISRQESAFDARARSPVGARGLMQIMPGTAKQIGRDLNRRVRLSQLYEPEHAIPLGAYYLSAMYQRFDYNRILATAAYNAGPERVTRALTKQTQVLPGDVWIETLPYSETRKYMQNVVAFAVIFNYQLGAGLQPMLASNERAIYPITQPLVVTQKEANSG